jgi:exosortase A-associated hydrolase 2
MEEPFFFAVNGYRLFAMAHRPADHVTPVAVVVCHPYGEEKQLSYPVLTRWGRMLAHDGFPVLRFDSRGYGDSDGDIEEATLESQVADTLAAGRTARERLGAQKVAYLGLRLGGLVAGLAAERDPAAAGLVLWSPVVSGKQYVDEMIRRRLFGELLSKRRTTREQVLEELATAGQIEIEGNYLTRTFVDEMSAADLATAAGSFRGPVLVSALKNAAGTVDSACEGLARAYEARGARCTLEISGERPYWERSAMYDHYFPEELFELTRRWMRAQWQTA